MKALLSAVTAILATVAFSGTYHLIGKDPNGSASFIGSTAGNAYGWNTDPGAKAALTHTVSGGNDYVVPEGTILRTPQNNSAYTFGGASMRLSGLFAPCGSSALTINNLTVENGLISTRYRDDTTVTLAGSIAIPGGKVLRISHFANPTLANRHRSLTFTAPISGSGNIDFNAGGLDYDTGSDVLVFAGDMSAFTGAIESWYEPNNPATPEAYRLTNAGVIGELNNGKCFVFKITGAYAGTIGDIKDADIPSPDARFVINHGALCGGNAGKGLRVSVNSVPKYIGTCVTFYNVADASAPNLPLFTFPAGTVLDTSKFTAKCAGSEATASAGGGTAFENLGVITNGDGTKTLVANRSGGQTEDPTLVWYTMSDLSGNITPETQLVNAASETGANPGCFIPAAKQTTVAANLPSVADGFVGNDVLRIGARGNLCANDKAIFLPYDVDDPGASGENSRGTAIRMDDPGRALDLQTFTLEFFFRTRKYTNWHGLILKPYDDKNKKYTFGIVETSYSQTKTTLRLYYTCRLADGSLSNNYVTVKSDAKPLIQDNAWHHLAVSVDGTTHEARLYVDGGLSGSCTLPGELAHTGEAGVNDWIIGGNPYGSWAWGGVVDEIRLSNRALEPDEFLIREEGVVAGEQLAVGPGETRSFAGDFTVGNGSALKVAGGTVRMEGTLYLAEGSSIELSDGGTITADRIVWVGGSGEIRVTLGAAGAERLVARSLELGENVTLAVDARGYAGPEKRIGILDFDELDGTFAHETVEGRATLVQRMSGGRWVEAGTRQKGLMVVFCGKVAAEPGQTLAGVPSAPTPFAPTAYGHPDAIFLNEVLSEAYHKSEGGIGHSFAEYPRIVYGDKELKFAHQNGTYDAKRLYQLSACRGGVQIFLLSFWGSAGSGSSNYGYPFADIADDPPRLEWDSAAGRMGIVKPYIGKDNQKHEFTCTVRPTEQAGRYRIDWDLGLPEGTKDFFGISPWIQVAGTECDYRSRKMTFGGVEYAKTVEELVAADKSLRTDIKDCDFVYADGEPEMGYSVGFEPKCTSGYLTESVSFEADGTTPKSFSLLLRATANKSLKGTIWLDFGPAAVFAGRPAPIGSVDFWGTDAIEVPTRPTRNLFPNPSFEQGLRYWRYDMSGTYTPVPRNQERFAIVTNGLFGGKALHLRSTQGQASRPQSFPLALEVHQTYTLSCYAKGSAGAKLSFGLQSPGQTGQFGKRTSTSFTLTEDWTRYSKTFTDDCGGIIVSLLQEKGDVLVDGIQLERGSSASEWTCDPVEGVLVTADADNDLFTDEELTAAYALVGAPGTEVGVTFRMENAFREEVFSSSAAVTLDERGRAEIPLDLARARLGEGVFVLRAEYAVAGYPTWCDHHRLSIMTPLENRHPTKNLFGTLSTRLDRIVRADDLARKFMQWGFGSTSWGSTAEMAPERNLLRMYKHYRITDMVRALSSDSKEISGQYLNWKDKLPDGIETRIEQLAYDMVRTNDTYFNIWTFGNEEEEHGLCGQKLWDEYAKAQLAFYRGVKRARPEAMVLPTCGTSAYRPGTKYVAISNYMNSALKKGVRYDAIAVHQYHNIDCGLLGEYDMDVNTQHLIDEMNSFGYPESAPVLTTETFNQTEVYLPQWGASGWGDAYSAGLPGYGFSHREFIQAASAARIWSIALKFWPKLASVNIWDSTPFLDCHLAPHILCKAANTFGHQFAEVSYHGSVCDDVRRLRAYVYRKPDGSASATVWTNDLDVERGRKKGVTLVLPSVLGLKVRDFMGNLRHPSPVEGGVGLPVTPAPLILTADSPEDLLSALRSAIEAVPLPQKFAR